MQISKQMTLEDLIRYLKSLSPYMTWKDQNRGEQHYDKTDPLVQCFDGVKLSNEQISMKVTWPLALLLGHF